MLCVGCEACDGNGIARVSRCDEVAGEVFFEISEVTHSEGGNMKSTAYSSATSQDQPRGSCIVGDL